MASTCLEDTLILLGVKRLSFNFAWKSLNYASKSVSDISTQGSSSSQRPFNYFLTQIGRWLKLYLHFCSLDSSNSFGNTSNAFIFSLRNKEELHPFKSMVLQSQYAIYRHQGYGPTFGNGWDIYISDNANSNSYSFTYLRTYEAPKESQDPTTILSGTFHFSPDDWEVFYLG